jgi:ferric-dicitrate binding protein FerR (iron transport regulator)
MMNEDSYDNGSNQQGALDCIKHIRFKPVETNPDMVYGNVLYRVRHEKLYDRGRVSPAWKYISVAALFALMLVSSYVLMLRKDEKITQAPPTSYIEISAIPGTKTRVLLPDSSTVWLNSSATLRYPQQFVGESRMVELKGEGLFDIKKDNEKPFIVSVAGIRIEVLGTVFNIFADSSSCVEVTLIEGVVSLYRDENITSVADRILNADQQALYNRETGEIKITEVNTSSFSSWVTLKFIFEKTSIYEIARELERAFNVKIHVENDSLKNICLNARFTHGETLDKILSILQIPARYTYIKKGGDIYIR